MPGRLIAVIFVCIALPPIPRADDAPLPRASRASFEPNVGQAPRRVAFTYRDGGMRAFLLRDGIKIEGVTMRFPPREPAGEDRAPGIVNSFTDTSRWTRGAPTSRRVRYPDVWAGIDLIAHGGEGGLEYDLLVAPGADPRAIAFTIEGARARLSADGDLVAGAQVHHAPMAFQGRSRIPARFAIDAGMVRFEVGSYDTSQPLVIDPVIRYVGGSGTDTASAMAVDEQGNAYVVGGTDSSDFPASGAVQGSYGGGTYDAFVTKLAPDGEIVYSTYLGSVGFDEACGIAVDPAGNAYVTGDTGGSGFPTTDGAFQRDLSGSIDTFIAKLTPEGALVYSTYLGGTDHDSGYGVGIAAGGDVWVSGQTSSTDFPVTPDALQPANAGGVTDAWVARITPMGQRAYATFLGGGGYEESNGLAIDPAGNVHLGGTTTSLDFPGADPARRGAGLDAYVARLGSSGQLSWSTYSGGALDDRGWALATDAAGRSFLAGDSGGTPPEGTPPRAFVAAYAPEGAELFRADLGGTSSSARAIAVGAGEIHAAGEASSGYPTTGDAVQGSYGGGASDAFLTTLTLSGTVTSSTYLGGPGTDSGLGLAPGPAGVVLAGTTSGPFPVTRGPAYGGGSSDVFIAFLGGGKPPPLSVAYFAEGTVRSGFVEYLTMLNPGDVTANGTIAFQASDDAGAPVPLEAQQIAVAPRSRVTVNVSGVVASQGVAVPVDVSMKVVADNPLVVERPVYFSADPGLGATVDGGTVVLGVSAPANKHLFAEGTVRPGFVEYIALQNPSDVAATVTLSFAASDDAGGPRATPPAKVIVGPGSRTTVNVNRHFEVHGITAPANVSVELTADTPVVAERPMYFSGPLGGADGGTSAPSVAPATLLHFAEGTLRPRYLEYLTVFNPGNEPATITLDFRAADDSGARVALAPATSVVPARSRATFSLPDLLGTGLPPLDVSVMLSADLPVVAERPLYFRADPTLGVTVDGATMGAGVPEPALTHRFAEGTARPGFVQYLALSNPGSETATATVTFHASDGAGLPLDVTPFGVAVPARGRLTVNVSRHVGAQRPLNVALTLASDRPIAAERVVYFAADPGLGTSVDGGTAGLGVTA